MEAVTPLKHHDTSVTSTSTSTSTSPSPSPSPNINALLKIKVISWSQETGFPVSVSVRVGNTIFNLHKYPMCAKSGYMMRKLSESSEIELPPEFPGGPETFEMIALFLYGSSTLIDPFNVAALRCAAEFLQMTEDYCTGNLCERFDLYLNQVVLQSWDDTLIVLQKCQALLPLSEELLIVSRCIESLAFTACMEILDPERRRDRPVVILEALPGLSSSCQTQDLWIKDLIALPFGFFARIIGSLRRQGMKEKYVSPIIVFYANKWLLSKRIWDDEGAANSNYARVSAVLKGIIHLLPIGEKASKVIPVGFYLALLSRSLDVGFKSTETKAKLQDQIAALLHLARVEDFLFPKKGVESVSSSIELVTVASIFSTYVSNADRENPISENNSIVAELWDKYLSHIAPNCEMGSKRFMELIETVPIPFRRSHDQLYRALKTFLQEHPEMSQEEKGWVCRYLNCQKLSQEACIEAVQNELMPLRLMVQALFAQQRNTHQALKDSFRYTHCGEFSGSLSNSKSQNMGESPYTDETLSFLLQKEIAMKKPEVSRNEYESTSFRIQSLEGELMSPKKSIQWHNNSSKQENGWVNFASQRRYASRVLRVLRRISLFGTPKSNKKSKPL